MSGLAYEVWASRSAQSLEVALRTDLELREKAKANGWWTELIARIESEERGRG